MVKLMRSRWRIKGANDKMRLLIITLVGIIVGFFLGASFQSHSPSSKVSTSSNILDLAYIEDKYSDLPTQALLNVWSSLRGRRAVSKKFNDSNIWVAMNPRGAERLPPGVVVAESDLYSRRIWGLPQEDLIVKPRYLMTFTVGYEQRNNINAMVEKLTENFQVMLFHYDGRASDWDEFEWSKDAIHVSVRKQAKWWYVKRFLHPDVVAPYDYIFIWDEDLGVENFDPEKYIQLVKEHSLDISQPGLSEDSGMTWQMTRRRNDTQIHKLNQRLSPPLIHLVITQHDFIVLVYTGRHRKNLAGVKCLSYPPCAAFVEIMAPVFSHKAWRCVWHMIQSDLVHGWGLDFALRKCVEPAHQKIGVVDSQWIVHQSVPSLGSQGKAENGREPWEGVRERCHHEWTLFQDRMAAAEKSYYQALGIDLLPNTILW